MTRTTRGVRAIRKGHDWVMVISALKLMESEEGLVERIRAAVIADHQSGSPIVIEAYGREAVALTVAIAITDEDRPAWWPPVSQAVI